MDVYNIYTMIRHNKIYYIYIDQKLSEHFGKLCKCDTPYMKNESAYFTDNTYMYVYMDS